MSLLSDLAKSDLTIEQITDAVRNNAIGRIVSGSRRSIVTEIAGVGTSVAERPEQVSVFPLLWVKITANETGGGKYQGKSYTHDGTTDVAATGNVAESELGTLSDEVDCRVLNFAEEGESTHDLTAGTPEIDTFLCHWFRTNSDGIKVCAVVAFDRATCA